MRRWIGAIPLPKVTLSRVKTLADIRDLKILPGGGGSDRRKKESERLDKFLDGLADPGVVRSLREEDAAA